MIEFHFRVTLKYRDGSAFAEVSHERAHARLVEEIKDCLESDPSFFRRVIIEVEAT